MGIAMRVRAQSDTFEQFRHACIPFGRRDTEVFQRQCDVTRRRSATQHVRRLEHRADRAACNA